MTLDPLEHAAARDLALTAHLRQPWLRPRTSCLNAGHALTGRVPWATP